MMPLVGLKMLGNKHTVMECSTTKEQSSKPTINKCKPETHLNSIQKFISYLTVNTLPLHYRDEVNDV
jgi:hypothetical protein